MLSQSTIKDDIHFICLDKRTKKPNGSTYIILDNGQEILLPPTVSKVPALLLLNQGHRVLFGDEIQTHFQPANEVAKMSSQPNGEPDAFELGGNSGVASDHFSFLDQTSEELSAKGDGGMRQNHHYAGVDFMGTIETPDDTYEPDTIGDVSMDKLQQQRNQEIGLK
jgi:hypothetical protein